MSCENYNLLKEGDLRVATISGSFSVSKTDFSLLYDGITTASGITIPGSGTSRLDLETEFGEAFDICYINYYSNEASASRIKIYYGAENGTENQATVSGISPGLYQATINNSARFIQTQHTVSSPTSLYELEIIGTRNETLGFGSSVVQAEDYLYLQHATADTRSASVNVIPIFNDNHFDEVAKVAIAPTLTEIDNYLYLSTTSSGIYYGINEYGFSQPGTTEIPLQNDSFLSSSLNSQWERISKSQPHAIVPTPEGLYFDLVHLAANTEASMFGTTGIISRDSFTAQSFTAEVEIRFLQVDTFTDAGTDNQQARDFFICLTDSYPIPDTGYFAGYLSNNRKGTSVGGATLKGTGVGSFDIDSATTSMRYSDGTSSDNPLVDNIDVRWTGGVSGPEPGEIADIDGPTLSDLLETLNDGDSIGDFTENAKWHKWIISYDHIKQELLAFMDKVYLGSHIYHVEPFKEGCRLFIGFHGNGGVKWQLRNFKIQPNKIYRQKNIALNINGGVASATVSGSFSYKVNDGSVATTYVAPAPTANTHLRIDFDRPYDIVNYRIRQHSSSAGVSAYGHTYRTDVARTSIVDFGGVLQEAHFYPEAYIDDFGTNTPVYIRKSPKTYGLASTISGVNYLDFQFTSYDRTTTASGALLIDELEVYAEYYVNALLPNSVDSRKFPWAKGKMRNIKQLGISNSLSMRDLGTLTTLPSYYPFPELFLAGIDYGYSSAINGLLTTPGNKYHHAETLFSSVFGQNSGQYAEWHSDIQTDNNFYIWRYFDERSSIGAIYWNSSTFRHNNVANKFKFQYLREAGDPNNNSDWVNISPITITHPYNSGAANLNYKHYRDYLIANNDGEYYTNYFNLTHDSRFSVADTIPDAEIPTGVIVPIMDGIIDTVRTTNTGQTYNNGLTGYIQFDSPVITRGIRMVMKDPKSAATPSVAKTQIALSTFHIFRSHAGASFYSPVFDTGTPQNTERVYVDAEVPSGTGMSIYIRSTNNAPTHVFDNYEFWETLGDIGNRDIEISELACNRSVRTISYNNETYFLFGSAEGPNGIDNYSPVVYNYTLDTWREMPDYPGVGDTDIGIIDEDGTTGVSSISPKILPDGRVENNATLIGTVLYLACKDTGELKSPRLAKINLASVNPTWMLFSDFRPTFTEDASMQSFGNRLYFLSKFGSVSYYDITENLWVQSSTTTPIYGGLSGRANLSTALYASKIYIFGGTVSGAGLVNTDVYDIDNNISYSVSSAPYAMVGHQAIVVPEEKVIYLIPRSEIAALEDATMKYFPEENRWEICESLMWARDRASVDTNFYSLSAFYYYYDGHIYAVDNNKNLLRTNVRKGDWRHGELPDFRDYIWGGRGSFINVPWIEIESFGELMPQDRYIQFKTELYSYDLINSPTIKRVSVITPQNLIVPASGTSNVYLKVGVSDTSQYQMWYSGEFAPRLNTSQNLSDDFSILYTESSDGLSWEFPTVASGVSYAANNSFAISSMSPSVIKNSINDYQIWYSRFRVGNTPTDKSIWYVPTTSPRNMSILSTAQQVIADGVISQTINGAYQPYVLKLSNISYIMYYTGIDASNIKRIIRAVSTNGINWTGHSVVITNARDGSNLYDTLGAYRPSVIIDDNQYKIWYAGIADTGIERILYSTSIDGITWSSPTLAVDVSSEGVSDMFGCTRPFIVKNVNTYYIYYFGYDSNVYHLIRASSPDGLEWANFAVAMPALGIHPTNDSAGLEDIFIIVGTSPVIPNRYFTGGSLKVYN